MLTLFIVLTLIAAYLATGLVISRNYHGRRAIAWEENYAKCKDCNRYTFSTSDRNHHSLCHDSRGKYKTMSFMLVLFWPILAPITARGGISAFYMQPIRQWEANQEDLLEQREFYQNELARISTSSTEYKIYKDALKGVDSQIVRKK